jgi:hypothetical protein
MRLELIISTLFIFQLSIYLETLQLPLFYFTRIMGLEYGILGVIKPPFNIATNFSISFFKKWEFK